MGTKHRRDREKERRKRDILDAAKILFFKQGFMATSMNQIAHAVELSKGTLYLYFKNKEELYISLLVEGMIILNNTFRKAIKNITGWEERLRTIGWAYYRYARDYPQFFQINFQFQQGEITAKISDSLYQICLDQGFKSLGFLSNAIEEGMNAGEIETDDPMGTAVVLWASLTGIILLHQAKDHRKLMPVPLETLVRKSIHISIEGLKTK